MILAGVLRRCTFIAEHFPGTPGRRTGQFMAASIVLAGSPDIQITKNRFLRRSLAVQPDRRTAPARV